MRLTDQEEIRDKKLSFVSQVRYSGTTVEKLPVKRRRKCSD
jgi:hypothetical protein